MMNLGRIGHYHVPAGEQEPSADRGYCQTAIVVGIALQEGTDPIPGAPNPAIVTLAVWTHTGTIMTPRHGVSVCAPMPLMASFHLSQDCPWQR